MADGDFGAAELATRAAQGTGVVAMSAATRCGGWPGGEALRELERSLTPSRSRLSLVAQVYYQMGDYVKAAEMYERLFAGIDSGAIGGGDGDSDDDEELDDDDRMELCTNLAAAYVNADLPRRALAVVERRFPQSHLYELLFNRACALIACGEFAEAREGLARAEAAARESMKEDGLSADQIETGCIIIRTTSAYVDQLCGNGRLRRLSMSQLPRLCLINTTPLLLPATTLCRCVAEAHTICSIRGSGSAVSTR